MQGETIQQDIEPEHDALDVKGSQTAAQLAPRHGAWVQHQPQRPAGLEDASNFRERVRDIHQGQRDAGDHEVEVRGPERQIFPERADELNTGRQPRPQPKRLEVRIDPAGECPEVQVGRNQGLPGATADV